MSNKPIAVKFLKSWRGYSKDEIAGFSQDEAQRLVDGEVAEFYGEDGKSSAGKGKGKGPGKAVAPPAAPTPGATDPTAGGSGDGGDDDNDEKP